MVTWMDHPRHGAHPATGIEIEDLKANGWTVRTKPVEPAEAPQATTPTPAPAAPRQRKKKA